MKHLRAKRKDQWPVGLVSQGTPGFGRCLVDDRAHIHTHRGGALSSHTVFAWSLYGPVLGAMFCSVPVCGTCTISVRHMKDFCAVFRSSVRFFVRFFTAFCGAVRLMFMRGITQQTKHASLIFLQRNLGKLSRYWNDFFCVWAPHGDLPVCPPVLCTVFVRGRTCT